MTKINNIDLSKPIVMDNRNLREQNPNIEKHFVACEAELLPFPKNKGIIDSSQYIDWVDCPVCGSSDSKQFVVKWGGRYDQCNVCSHVYIKNRFKKEILLKFYRVSQADKIDREVQKNDFNRHYWEAVYEK
jgi:hypothetical protein